MRTVGEQVRILMASTSSPRVGQKRKYNHGLEARATQDVRATKKEHGLEARATNMMAEILRFDTELRKIIPPKTQSDRTGFHNIAQWLVNQVKEGTYTADIFDRVLGYASEAAGPACHNPAAVFITILKRELGYKK